MVRSREPPPGDDEMVFIRQTNKQMNQTLNKINNAKAKNENMSSNSKVSRRVKLKLHHESKVKEEEEEEV